MDLLTAVMRVLVLLTCAFLYMYLSQFRTPLVVPVQLSMLLPARTPTPPVQHTVQDLETAEPVPVPSPAPLPRHRIFFRYIVKFGFMNQLGAHLTASVLMRALAEDPMLGLDGVLLPYAVTKTDDGLWSGRTCCALGSMFNTSHFRKRWSRLIVVDAPCVEGSKIKKYKFHNVGKIPGSVRNVTVGVPRRGLGLQDVMKDIHKSILRLSSKIGDAPLDIIIDGGSPWGLFHVPQVGGWRQGRLTDDEVRLFRESAGDWVLTHKLQTVTNTVVSHFRDRLRKKIIVWHLRGEADGVFMDVPTQIKLFTSHVVSEKIDLEDHIVYLATGMDDFQRNPTTNRVIAVRSELTNKKWIPLPLPHGATVAKDIVPEAMASLTFELAAAFQFFVALEASYVMSVSMSSWGSGIAQYRMLLRNNTNTILFGINANLLLSFHVYFYSKFPEEFCRLNRIGVCP